MSLFSLFCNAEQPDLGGVTYHPREFDVGALKCVFELVKFLYSVLALEKRLMHSKTATKSEAWPTLHNLLLVRLLAEVEGCELAVGVGDTAHKITTFL